MLSRLSASSSPISPVLFLTVDGESMRFFLRPGPTKVQLQPIIKAGGGFVCRVQEPGTILLADPDEMGSNPGSAAHGYVSTQYIRDCVEKNQQLEVEDYLFKPGDLQVNVLSGSERKRGRTSGRMMYTPEDDAAILKYVSEHEGEVRGNTFWREMEKNGLTNHSWQSMKDRYRKYLRDRQPKNAASALEEKRGNSSEEDAGPQPSSPQGDSPLSSDITPVGAGTEERPVECATAASPQPETEQSSSGATTSNATEGQVGKKRAKKRKLGILERAVREFEGSDESVHDEDDDETPDLAESVAPSSASRTTQPGSGQETQTSASAPQPENGSPKPKKSHRSPAQEKRSETQPGYQPPEAGGPAKIAKSIPVTEEPAAPSASSALGSPGPNTLPSTSTAPHLFLFEHESQQVEEDEASQPLTQLQLDQAKQHLLSLIKDSKLGLVDITKALLKNSGVVSAALQDPLILPNPVDGAWQGPRWERCDDRLLLSGDTSELQKKFGERGIARRLAFLDAD
ncbi:telomeric repeat-binding factor 2-interacting protein 1 isoform X2 [Esox lucius]|uniref:telomeric repeat-binding factor 2-interacting protein 1 isoform X2 n=1 Tax=Esox lucius TaxID=8010 RepID=UPI001476B718|nr:telomeric repeat-binding factor 2-interacting protein 1 isoform X2 [Esox lucius]